MTEAQRDILRHSLGLNYGTDLHRNYYATGPGASDFDDIEALVAAGLMRRGREIPDDTGLRYYHVTEAGKRALEADRLAARAGVEGAFKFAEDSRRDADKP
jgi:hypothetical protein